MELTEQVVMNCLFADEAYVRKALPFVEREYFQNESNKVVFDLMKTHIEKYNDLPTKDSLLISLDEKNVSENIFNECKEMVVYLHNQKDEHRNSEWQLDATEKWCQDRAIYNAVMKSITIINDDSPEKGEMPKILSEALAVSFDSNIGHDFIEDWESRFEFYQRVEEKIPFHLDMLNRVTKGGLPKKTLNVALAGTGVGKSLFMCDCAANHLLMGYDVLYITCEMSEEKIAERIDANLLNTSIQDVATMARSTFDKKIDKLQQKTTGKLIIKEYPTAVANANHFRHLLNELSLKKNFRPKIIYIDYLNICSSSRVKPGAGANSYTLIKSIAEELRGLAVENNVPIVTATQTTRGGYGNSDVDLTDTSESFGLPATADLMFALIATEELEEMSQILIKQLKNRYNDPNEHKRFVVGIDRPKMRLYDVEDDAQDELIQDTKESHFKESFSKKHSNKKIGNVEITI
jgi:replicative DNA helicase|tara:strand:+ start:275 stop:1663 length:1389 start_codon:yes stop_codon:yes gene_type:complete